MKRFYERFAKRTLLLILTAHLSLLSFAATYYVSNTGNDSNNGTSTSTPWKTIFKVNAVKFQPGDLILFKCGDVWRETLTVSSSGTISDPITIGSYGTGDKPKILGSTKITTWTNSSGNIWVSSNTCNDPNAISGAYGNIYFIETNSNVSWGRVKKANTGACVTEYDWTWSSSHIYIYSPTDPNTRYVGVEATQRTNTIILNDKPYLTINGLELAYFAGAGITDNYPTTPISGLTIKNCHIHHAGIKSSTNAFGMCLWRSNALIQNNEIHDCGRRNISILPIGSTSSITISNIIIEENILYHGFHTTGVDLINVATNCIIDGVIIRKNLIYDDISEMLDGIESYSSEGMFIANQGGASVKNIYIYNNVVKNTTLDAIKLEAVNSAFIYNNTIYGVNPNLRTTSTAQLIVTYGTNCTIRNNIVYNNVIAARNAYHPCLLIGSDAGTVTSDNNLFYNSESTSRIVGWRDNNYTPVQWTSYKTTEGQDAHSPTPSNPNFVSSSDYNLQSSSPAINLGLDVGLTTDYYGSSIVGLPDIGAYEYGSTSMDSEKPIVTGFSVLSTPTILSVSISSITATDNIGVTGYLLTETSTLPTAGATGWSSSKPTNYTFTSVGSKTLYAWAKDAAGNVSTSLNANVIISSPVASTFTFVGPSSGNVNSVSTNFTITPNNLYTGTITISPSGIGSTGIPPIVLTFSNSSTAQTFAITPIVAGSITLTATNSGTLINPANLTYTVNALPIEYNVTGGGSYCNGGSGVAVGLSNSQIGVNYQLHLGGVNNGTAIAGSGSAITFGNKTVAGNYTVVANKGSIASAVNMIGSVTVTVYPKYSIIENITIQQGQAYQTWTKSGQYVRTLSSASGCDSIVTTNLNVTANIIKTENKSICQGTTYNGWTTTGKYVRTLISKSGADSIVTTNLTVNPTYTISENITIKQGQTYTTWTTSGQYVRNLSTVSGCDSLVTTNLNVLVPVLNTEYKSICDGANYNGWLISGKYVRTLSAKSGADSIVTTYLTVNPKYSITENITIQDGQTYNGWTKTGIYTRTLSSVSGCDSIVTTNLTVAAFIMKGGGITPTHFVTVWTGQTGYNLMNINVASAILEDLPLSANDEIAVYDGTSCVGAMKLSQTINSADNTTFLTIPASQKNGTINGFSSNDTIMFKIWDNKNQKEMLAKAVTYRHDVSTWLTTGKYASGAISTVEIVSFTEYTQTINLRKGSNLFSTYLTPTNPKVNMVMKALVDQKALIKMQDEAGHSYEYWGTYGGWINKIGSIAKTEGYSVSVNFNCTLQITGRMIVLPLNIHLTRGWNFISYPRTDIVNAMNIIQTLIDQKKLVKVQDELGNSIENLKSYGGWKNNIGNFVPGKGYKINVSADVVLTIQQSYPKSADILVAKEQPVYFSTQVEGNGINHMNINFIGLNQSGLSVGDEIAAFDGDICVGALKITTYHLYSGTASLIASYLTNSVKQDGFIEDHPIQIYYWNQLTGEKSGAQVDVVEGQLNFQKNASVLVQMNMLSTDIKNIVDMVKIDVFPNPSKGKITVRFSQIPVAGSRIDILDITGRKVTSRLISETSEEFNLDQQAAGIYLVKSVIGSTETIQKLILSK